VRNGSREQALSRRELGMGEIKSGIGMGLGGRKGQNNGMRGGEGRVKLRKKYLEKPGVHALRKTCPSKKQEEDPQA